MNSQKFYISLNAKHCARFFYALISLSSLRGLAANITDLIQFQADKYTTNLETKKTEVEGNVHLKLGNRELYADKLSVDAATSDVECVGHVLYKNLKEDGKKIEIEANGVKFNFRSGLGKFFDAVVKSEGAFHLEGKEITREAETVFVAKVGKISFCQDCPQSWSLVGDRVKVNTEKYAEVHHALVQVKDTPVMYLPFVYYPAQNKRFSGFLIPYFRYSKALGAQLGIPFYYVPNNLMDFTLDYRYMSEGGHRNALETRVQYSEYSFWNSNTSWIRTLDNSRWTSDRIGLHYEGRAQFLSNFALITSGNFVSDTEMSKNFEEDSLESRLPNYSNDIFLESQYENFSLFAGARIPQDNLDRNLTSRGDVSWTLPQLKAGIPLSPIGASLLSGVSVEALGVRRFKNGNTGSLLERDPVTNYIASGDRYSVLLDASLPVNFDILRSTSRVALRGDYYDFPRGIDPNQASRARLVLEQNLEMDFWRVWHLGWSGMPRVKHIMTPYVGISYSPPDSHSKNDFFKDCPAGSPCATTAPRLDPFDGGLPTENVSLGTEEAEFRLRDHNIVTYGFKTQLLGKMSSNVIQEVFFLDVNQEYDLKEQRTGKLKLLASGTYAPVTLSTQLAWDMEKSKVDLINNVSLEGQYYRVSFFQSIRSDTDNLGGEIRLKKLGPFELASEHNYDRKLAKLIEQKYFVSYRSFSNCWSLNLGLRRRLGDKEFEYAPSVQVLYTESVKNRTSFNF